MPYRHIVHAARLKQQRDVLAAAIESRKQNTVLMLRAYRDGEIPDVQVALQSFVVPLQALCLYDTEVARASLESIGEGILRRIHERSSPTPLTATAGLTSAVMPSTFLMDTTIGAMAPQAAKLLHERIQQTLLDALSDPLLARDRDTVQFVLDAMLRSFPAVVVSPLDATSLMEKLTFCQSVHQSGSRSGVAGPSLLLLEALIHSLGPESSAGVSAVTLGHHQRPTAVIPTSLSASLSDSLHEQPSAVGKLQWASLLRGILWSHYYQLATAREGQQDSAFHSIGRRCLLPSSPTEAQQAWFDSIATAKESADFAQVVSLCRAALHGEDLSGFLRGRCRLQWCKWR